MGATEKEQGVPWAGLVMMCRGRDWWRRCQSEREVRGAGCGQNINRLGYALPKQVVFICFCPERWVGGGRAGSDWHWGGSLCQVLLPLGAVGSRYRNPDKGGSH